MNRTSHQTQANSDQTWNYEVTGYKAKTFKDFIDEVLEEFPSEFGYFRVNTFFTCGSYTHLSYKRGKLQDKIPSELAIYELRVGASIFDRELERVEANGGWGTMDYDITLKPL